MHNSTSSNTKPLQNSSKNPSKHLKRSLQNPSLLIWNMNAAHHNKGNVRAGEKTPTDLALNAPRHLDKKIRNVEQKKENIAAGTEKSNQSARRHPSLPCLALCDHKNCAPPCLASLDVRSAVRMILNLVRPPQYRAPSAQQSGNYGIANLAEVMTFTLVRHVISCRLTLSDLNLVLLYLHVFYAFCTWMEVCISSCISSNPT